MSEPAAVTDERTVGRVNDLLLDAFHATEAAYDNWPTPSAAPDPTAEQYAMEHAVRARDLLNEAIAARLAAITPEPSDPAITS